MRLHERPGLAEDDHLVAEVADRRRQLDRVELAAADLQHVRVDDDLHADSWKKTAGSGARSMSRAGVPHHMRSLGHVARHDRAHADHRPGADRDLLAQAGPAADVGALGDMARSADAHAGGQRCEVVDAHVVGEHDLGHDRHVATDDDVGGQVGVGEQDRAGADLAGRPDRRRRMHDRRVAIVVEPELAGDEPAADVVVRAARGDDELRVRVLVDELDRPEHRHAADLASVQRRAVVEEAEQAPRGAHGVQRAHGLGGLAREAARSDEQQIRDGGRHHAACVRLA